MLGQKLKRIWIRLMYDWASEGHMPCSFQEQDWGLTVLEPKGEKAARIYLPLDANEWVAVGSQPLVAELDGPYDVRVLEANKLAAVYFPRKLRLRPCEGQTTPWRIVLVQREDNFAGLFVAMLLSILKYRDVEPAPIEVENPKKV